MVGRRIKGELRRMDAKESVGRSGIDIVVAASYRSVCIQRKFVVNFVYIDGIEYFR